MQARMAACLLSFVVASAPLAAIACQTICAARESPRVEAGSHPSGTHDCHTSSVPSGMGSTLADSGHVCDHVSGMPVTKSVPFASGIASRGLPAPAFLVQNGSLRFPTLAASPPPAPGKATPLRI